MFALAFDEALANRHGPLVRLAAAIAGGDEADAAVVLLDNVDTAPRSVRDRTIMLRRGPAPAIHHGTDGFELVYSDPAGEASIAALVACVAATGGPIAADPGSMAVLALARRLAASDIPVLINGPTGTGKEVLSRYIHDRSARSDKPFIAVNCAAMPEAMLEALLFGHMKGAFTGASAEGEGFFRAADGGTLLLDEIAEMPLALQAKLLRALQEGEVVPIGATRAIKVDVRVIACANRDLPTEVAENRFRADLFYRLNVFPLALRPLRERGDDIAPLAFALAIRHTSPGGRVPWISNAALAMLRLHGWPGNVRELENVVRRALLLAGDALAIGSEHIVFDQPARLVAAGGGTSPSAPAADERRLSNIVQFSEARAIMDTLAACNGSRVAAARELGISERTLRYRLASFREAGLTVAGRGR
jgi:two-component system response regulator FlrC